MEKEVKLSLFADNMILYIENPKDAIRKLLEIINRFSEVAGYIINTYYYTHCTHEEIKALSIELASNIFSSLYALANIMEVLVITFSLI